MHMHTTYIHTYTHARMICRLKPSEESTKRWQQRPLRQPLVCNNCAYVCLSVFLSVYLSWNPSVWVTEKLIWTVSIARSLSLKTWTHMYVDTYVHTYIHKYPHTYIVSYIHTYIHTYINTQIHTHIHTYVVRTYINTHTYTRTFKRRNQETYSPGKPQRSQISCIHTKSTNIYTYKWTGSKKPGLAAIWKKVDLTRQQEATIKCVLSMSVCTSVRACLSVGVPMWRIMYCMHTCKHTYINRCIHEHKYICADANTWEFTCYHQYMTICET